MANATSTPVSLAKPVRLDKRPLPGVDLSKRVGARINYIKD